MENPSKRTMFHAAPQQVADPHIASLATLGMRIRQSVAQGYKVNPAASYNSQYFQEPAAPQFVRVALPDHMAAPPALTSDGSTFQLGLSVSEWGAPVTPVTTLPVQGVKRGYDAEPVKPVLPTYDEFCLTNGQLVFDDDF